MTNPFENSITMERQTDLDLDLDLGIFQGSQWVGAVAFYPRYRDMRADELSRKNQVKKQPALMRLFRWYI